jgi:hypothetical protein
MKSQAGKLKRWLICAFSVCFTLIACLMSSGCTMIRNYHIAKINQAIIDKDMDELETLLAQKKNVSCREYTIAYAWADFSAVSHTPLNTAILNTNENAIRMLVEHGADVNYPSLINNNKETPLHTAAMTLKIDLMDYLIENGADVNITDSEGNKPIVNCMYWTLSVDNEDWNWVKTREEFHSYSYQTFCYLLQQGTTIEEACRYGHLIF